MKNSVASGIRPMPGGKLGLQPIGLFHGPIMYAVRAFITKGYIIGKISYLGRSGLYVTLIVQTVGFLSCIIRGTDSVRAVLFSTFWKPSLAMS